MKRSSPASPRSTATRSSRALKCRRAITAASRPRGDRGVKLEPKTSTSSSSSTRTTSTQCITRSYLRGPADDLAEEAVRRPSRGDAPGEEDRRRPARDARPGICGGDQAMRARHIARDCVTPSRGQQGAVLFRDIGDHKPTPELLDMATMLIDQHRRVRRRRVPQPLRRCAEGLDCREAAQEGREGHPGPGRGRAAVPRLQRRRPDGGAEEEPRRRFIGRNDNRGAAAKKPAAKPAAKELPRAAPPPRRRLPEGCGGRPAAVNGDHQARHRHVQPQARLHPDEGAQGPQAQGQGRQLHRPEA